MQSLRVVSGTKRARSWAPYRNVRARCTRPGSMVRIKALLYPLLVYSVLCRQNASSRGSCASSTLRMKFACRKATCTIQPPAARPGCENSRRRAFNLMTGSVFHVSAAEHDTGGKPFWSSISTRSWGPS